MPTITNIQAPENASYRFMGFDGEGSTRNQRVLLINNIVLLSDELPEDHPQHAKVKSYVEYKLNGATSRFWLTDNYAEILENLKAKDATWQELAPSK